MRMRGFVVVGAVLSAVALVLTGCTSGPGPDRGGCVPRMTVEPREVHPGDTVTLSSGDVCDASVPDGGWVVAVQEPREDGRRVTVRSKEPLDGSWSVSVPLPADFTVGDASFGISNWDYSTCPDGASCAGPISGFTVVAATPTPTP